MDVQSNGKTAPVETKQDMQTKCDKAAQDFVLLWGEMASSWGINRTMAQIHALLYIADEPLDTDAIMARLGISRGNANMNLRTLMGWDLIRKVHQMGSRKDYYTSEKDVWKMSAVIIQERMRREIKPVRTKLEQNLQDLIEGVAQHSDDASTPREARLAERLQSFITLLQLFEQFADAILPVIQGQKTDNIRHLSEMAEQLGDF